VIHGRRRRGRRRALAAALLLLLGGSGCLQEREREMSGEETGAWVGRWRKAEEAGCPAPYPEVLVVREGGIYEAPGAAEAGSRFHSGDVALEEGEEGATPTLLLQAAHDAMVRHRVVERTDEAFVLETSEGCRVRYRRTG
jgi:hypothetical protein